MSFLGTEKLKSVLEQNIPTFKPERIQSGKYELSLGTSFYASDLEEFKVESLSIDQQIVINPGQFALLITEEVINIPKKYIGFISIKAGIKFSGLVNISGFHVDPGFNGRLKFSVYNAGSNKINLTVGSPVFQLWLANLTGESDYDGTHQRQMELSSADLNKYMQGEVASPAKLQKQIDELASAKERNLWYLKFCIGIAAAILLRIILSLTPFEIVSQGIVDERVNTTIDKINFDSLIDVRIRSNDIEPNE